MKLDGAFGACCIWWHSVLQGTHILPLCCNALVCFFVPNTLLQHKTRNPSDPTDPGLNLLLLAAKHGHAAVVKVAIQHR
jgi:hypothetical protein